MNPVASILVVDDAPESLRLLTDVLSAQGYRVRPADCGELALASVAMDPPDLMLLDVRMPGMDGFELCRRIKALDALRPIPLLFLSASQDREEHRRGFELGAVDFITKPFQEWELVARVRTHLELSQLRRNLEQQVAERTQALEASAESYRLVADYTYDWEWLLDPKGIFIYSSPSCLRITGYAPEDLPDDAAFEAILHPEDRAAWKNHQAESRLLGGHADLEVRILRRDGSVGWISHVCQPVFRDGCYVGQRGSNRDISERKQLEEARRLSEARLDEAFQGSPLGMALVGLDGRFFRVNPSFCRMLGRTEADLLDLSIQDITYPEDRATTGQQLRELLEGRVPSFRMQKRYCHASGWEIWGEVHASLLRDDQGRPVHLMAQIEDITWRRLAEEELRASEEKFSKMFRNAPMLLSLTDIETGTYLDVNEAFLKASGYARGEVLGRTSIELGWVSAEDRKRLLEELQTQGRVTGLQLNLCAKDGRRVVVIYDGNTVIIRGRSYLLSSAQDITDRVRAEEALLESEAKQRLVATHSRDSIWFMGPDLRFTYLSPSTERMFGYTIAEWATLDWNAFVHPDFMAPVVAVFQGLRDQPDQVGASAEAKVWHKDGHDLWVEFSTSAIRDATGTLLGFAGVTRDITDRKRTEETLHEALKMAASIVEHIPSGIFIYQVCDGDRLVLLDANPEAERLTQVLRDRDLGKDFEDLWPNEASTGLKQACLDAVHSGQPYETQELYYADNRLSGAYRVHAFAIPGGRLVVAFEDITERLQAELAVKKALEQAEQYFQNAGVMMVALDRSGCITRMNRKGHEILGYADEDLTGRDWFDLYLPQEVAPAVRSVFFQILAGEIDAAAEYENEVVTRDGTVRLMHWYNSFIRDAEGGVVGSLSSGTDITEQRQAEAALKESHLRLALATASARIGVWDWDLARGTMNWDDRMLELYGITRESFTGTVEAWIAGVHPEDLARAQAESQVALDGGTPFDTTFRLLNPDGTVRWVKADGLVQRDEHGQAVRMVGLNRDVTQQVLMEGALKESQGRYASMAENSPLALYRYSDRRGGLYYSTRIQDLLGYSPAELLAQPSLWHDSIHPEDLPEVDAAIAGMLAGNPRMEVVYRIRHASGETRWFHDRAQGHFQEDGELILDGAAADITERKRMEEALAQSESTLRAIFENSTDAIGVSFQGIHHLVNRSYAALFGYDHPDVFPGMPVLEVIAPEERPRVQAYIRDRAAGAPVPSAYEVLAMRKDGTRFLMDNRVSTFELEGRRATLVILRDITETRRAEEQQRLLESQLQHAQKMESLGNLAGGVAHDLNNVLAAILGMTSSFQGRFQPPDPMAEGLETISKACIRGRDVVRNLLVFARRELGEERPVDLNAVVREAVDLLSHTTLKRVDLVTDLQEPLPRILGEVGTLSHCVVNLCVNAVDAMPQGGTITLQTRLRPDGAVLLAVRDTGIGMDPEVLARATEPFFTTKPQGKGTGLGLAMVYGAMQAHDGRVVLHSQPGVGTEVALEFPASRVVADADAGAAQAPTVEPPGTFTVLAVDDDELVLGSVQIMLELTGHQVHIASGGREALRMLEAGLDPHVVILDMNMPGLSGLETLPLILALRPGQPVLLASGYLDDAMLTELAAYPSVKTIGKPFSMEELQQALLAVTQGPRP